MAQQEEELSFEEGVEMDLLEQDDPDWYLVKLGNGEIGLAPSNYVQAIDGADSTTYHHEEQPIEQAQEEEEEQYHQQQAPIPTPPPIITQASIPPPPLQPVLSQPVSFYSVYAYLQVLTYYLFSLLDWWITQRTNC